MMFTFANHLMFESKEEKDVALRLITEMAYGHLIQGETEIAIRFRSRDELEFMYNLLAAEPEITVKR